MARAQREKLIETPAATRDHQSETTGLAISSSPNRRTMGLRSLHDVGDLALGDTFRLLQALLVPR